MRSRLALVVSLIAVAFGSASPPARAVPDRPSRPGAAVATPEVSLPPAGAKGHALWDSFFDLSEYGYEEQEFFVSGVATNGTTTAPYTTRVIVFRPDTVADNGPGFNGTVVLDWVNVTAQFENAVDTIHAHEFLLREGYAWVHVSAQAAGIDTPFVPNPLVPKKWDPERYAALSHPGDTYSFDIFSQVAKAMKAGGAGSTPIDPMGTLDVDYVLAAGQSQSAERLTSYVRDWQPSADVIDGFLIHGTTRHDGPATSPVPVVHLESDADVAPGAVSNLEQNIALWEVAGTAHSDLWIGYHQVFGQGPRSQASAPKISRADKEAMELVAGNYGEQLHPMLGTCTIGGATMPMYYATSAAISHLEAWVRHGIAPPIGPKIDTDRFGSVVAGEFGNVRGGIRLAPIVHPVAAYVSHACELGGKTVPFSEAQLLAMYGSHQHYYELFAATTAENVADGWLLHDDAVDLLKRACDSRNRFGVPQQVAVPYCDGYAIAAP